MAAWAPPPAPELALDLGTGLTRLAQRGGGLLVEQPSVPAAPRSRGALALEECPEPAVVHGVVVDPAVAAQLLVPHLRSGRGALPVRPRVLVCHPSDASAAERERLVEAALLAGASAVGLVPQPVAAARALPRAGLASGRPELVVDVGEGVTDVALVQANRLVGSAAFRTGLAELRENLRRAVLEEHDVALQDAELATLLESPARHAGDPDWLGVDRVGAAREQERGGRRVLRRVLLVRAAAVGHVLEQALGALERAAFRLLDSLSRGERARVLRAGLLFAGGGARIAPLREALAQRLGCSLWLPPRPLHAVVLGGRSLLERGPRPDWRRS